MELVPRLALGALLANTSLTWGQLAIDANNALCQAIGQATSARLGAAPMPAPRSWSTCIGVLIYLVTSLLLLLQMLMRLALVDVLLVISPLALLCWVLPPDPGLGPSLVEPLLRHGLHPVRPGRRPPARRARS